MQYAGILICGCMRIQMIFLGWGSQILQEVAFRKLAAHAHSTKARGGQGGGGGEGVGEQEIVEGASHEELKESLRGLPAYKLGWLLAYNEADSLGVRDKRARQQGWASPHENMHAPRTRPTLPNSCLRL